MRTRAIFYALISILMFLAGCQGSQQNLGGVPNLKRYTGAVSLSPGASELIASKLNGVPLMGRTAQCNWPVTNAKIPIVMKGTKPNYEQIALLKPPIVIYDEGLFTSSEIEKFKDLGIETFAVEGNTIEDFVKCLYRLGTKFHSETICSDYVDMIHAAVSAAEGAPPTRKLKVAVLMPGSGSEHYIAGTESFVADVIRKSQGDIVGPKSSQFVAASAESLVAMNPDLIISSGIGTSIEKDPRLQSINAVKLKRVVPVDPDILLRRGARVNTLIRGIYNILSEAAGS